MSLFRTSSSAETSELGERVGTTLVKRGLQKRATIIVLRGELGAGKTTFVRGIYKGLGSKGRVMSPTFILVRRSALRKGPFKNIFHADAYRLHKDDATETLGIHEAIAHPENIVLIEWPERLSPRLVRGAHTILFRHGKTEHERAITIPQSLL